MRVRETIHRLRSALSIVDPGAFAVSRFRCPLCRARVLIRLQRSVIGVRCIGCGSSAITLSMAAALLDERPGFRAERVYELSSRGPLFEWLRREVTDLTWSEYFDDVPAGEWRDGVQCQDIERLTYPDACFDVLTCTEVFEHVADDRAGYAQARRVLRPNGAFIFTVPIEDVERTVERAVLREGRIEHLLPPVYHGDRIRGSGRVLVFRDYGRDVVARLLAAGFAAARIERRYERAFLATGRGVVVARVG